MYFINITISNKNDIPSLIDKIRKAGIDIYQINVKNNLEDLFLSLIEK
jgi:ABC-2 type transport system ATP-binding protein